MGWAGSRDLRGVRAHIAQDSEYYADRFVERILAAVENLMAFPQMGRVVPEIRDPGIRELLFNNYRIMYRAETDRVLIIAVAHAARDWSQHESKPWDVA